MIHVVIPSLDYPTDAILSVYDQSQKAKIWVVVDNCLREKVIKPTPMIFIWYREGRHFAARNIYDIINKHVGNEAIDEDIICILDGDDKLKKNALAPVEAAYRNPKIWLTYGSYDRKSGDKRTFNGPYRSGRSVRSSRWHATHLKTFRYGLWKHLSEHSLKDKNGQWLITCADVAIMIPLIEMAGFDRTRFIKQIIYQYNDENPENDHKVRPELQIATDKLIRSLTPYERLESL